MLLEEYWLEVANGKNKTRIVLFSNSITRCNKSWMISGTGKLLELFYRLAVFAGVDISHENNLKYMPIVLHTILKMFSYIIEEKLLKSLWSLIKLPTVSVLLLHWESCAMVNDTYMLCWGCCQGYGLLFDWQWYLKMY